MLAPELDPAALWQGWPWDTEAKSAAGAVAEHSGARPRGKRAPLPPGRALDQAARSPVRCHLLNDALTEVLNGVLTKHLYHCAAATRILCC